MRVLVWLPMPITAAHQRRLDEVTAGHELVTDLALLETVDIALGNMPPERLASAGDLRWLQLASTGVDAYRELDWTALGPRLTVTNMRGIHAVPVAESCLSGLLALQRGIVDLAGQQATRTWVGGALRPGLRELHGARVVILGAGPIAQRLAGLLAAFQCPVTLFGRTSGDVHTLAELDALLPHTDVVCSLLPDTPQTRGLLDARRIGLIKPGGFLVNAGRGSVLDQAAVVAALRGQRLAGAVLDVTVAEPLPADDPLWGCPNLLLTQHTAGGSDREPDRVIDVFATNLARFTAGSPLVNVVDWAHT